MIILCKTYWPNRTVTYFYGLIKYYDEYVCIMYIFSTSMCSRWFKIITTRIVLTFSLINIYSTSFVIIYSSLSWQINHGRVLRKGLYGQRILWKKNEIEKYAQIFFPAYSVMYDFYLTEQFQRKPTVDLSTSIIVGFRLKLYTTNDIDVVIWETKQAMEKNNYIFYYTYNNVTIATKNKNKNQSVSFYIEPKSN